MAWPVTGHWPNEQNTVPTYKISIYITLAWQTIFPRSVFLIQLSYQATFIKAIIIYIQI